MTLCNLHFLKSRGKTTMRARAGAINQRAVIMIIMRAGTAMDNCGSYY